MIEKEDVKKLKYWIILPGILAGIAAVITSVAIYNLSLQIVEINQNIATLQKSQSQNDTTIQIIPNQGKGLTTLHKEISFRIEEIHSILYQDPLTAGPLGNATQRQTAHGVGISEAYIDWELRTLLFELEQVSPDDEKIIIEKIRNLFDEFSNYGPEAPYSVTAPIDTLIIRSAREKFEEIENEWRNLLEKYD